MSWDWKRVAAALSSVVVFRNVVKAPPLKALCRFLELEGGTVAVRTEKYSAFVAALFAEAYRLNDYLRDALLEDENDYVLMRAHGEAVPGVLQRCVDQELDIFTELTRLIPAELAALTGKEGYLPLFENESTDLALVYEQRMARVRQFGYGIYVRNRMFQLSDGKITPVKSADPVTLDDLIGYEDERRQVVDNTRALLAGKPAANILLCGDAGTGKSSTVKAVTNLLAPDGLRLIELRKEQILSLPMVMEELSRNPLKFILFIDDLSFHNQEEGFGTLKAILEGSVSVRNDNTVIYATSNRRHLIRENFSARDGDDVHRNDTLQELGSLSERFGLTVLFSKPDKALYLKIVNRLAEVKNIHLERAELERQAEAFALRKGGRSARAAEQFTDRLVALGTGKEAKEC